MSKKKEKIDLNNLAPEEELKYEIAKELGLLDKVMEQGWKAHQQVWNLQCLNCLWRESHLVCRSG